SQLPPVVETATLIFLPLTHLANLTRGLVVGRADVFTLLSLAWITIVTIALFLLSINLMKKRLIK
ncbi:MAG: ABC transporter permease, partial [Candidatus Bathyarchaeia archaeon]